METATPTLETPPFGRYMDGKRKFCLFKGPITEDSIVISCNRWRADRILDDAVRQYGVEEGTVRLPKLIEYWKAVEQNPRARQSILPKYGEYLLHLILPAGARTVTPGYVLKNEDGKTLRPANRARLLNPTGIQRDRRKKIVQATVFDLPFELREGRYDPEMLDPESGFLKEAPKSEGHYGICFGSENRLYASFLHWNGLVCCSWGPSVSDAGVGFRGASTGSLPNDLLE